jgi:transposase
MLAIKVIKNKLDKIKRYVYTNIIMATLQKKKVHGREYWYIVECRRVNGKPRPFVLEYIGKAENLLKRIAEQRERRVKSFSHGAVSGLINAGKDIELLNILDKNSPEQKRDGLTVGQTILLGAIHRVIRPASKRSFSQWAETTTLPELLGFDAQRITSQHFWDQMDAVSQEDIERIEEEIIRTVDKKYRLNWSVLFYDSTNFYTYINTTNLKNTIGQRGNNKQKRDDLRQYNLALLTTKDFFLPIFSYIYQGNRNDVSIFPEYLEKMLEKLKSIVGQVEEITLVFDKGNNSPKGMDILKEKKLGYVGTLSIYSHPDLIKIPYKKYHQIELTGGKKILVHRTEKELWGKEHRIIIKRSEKLKDGQTRGFLKEIDKKVNSLKLLKEKLNSSGARKRNKEQLQEQITKIISGQLLKGVIRANIKESVKNKSGFDISWVIDKKAQNKIINEVFGKKIFFTNRMEWTNEEIIEAYHGQSKIERIFRHLKNPYHFSVRPQYHWTDQKIKVHTFICLLGLLLGELLRKKLFDAGMKMSLEEIIERLSNIRKSNTIYYTGKKGKPKAESQLESMSNTEKAMWKIIQKTAV